MKINLQSTLFAFVSALIIHSNAQAQNSWILPLKVKYVPQAEVQVFGDKTCVGALNSVISGMQQAEPDGFRLHCRLSENGKASCDGFNGGSFETTSKEFHFYNFTEGSISGGDATPTVLHMISGKVGSNQGFYEIRRINAKLAFSELQRVGSDAFRMSEVAPICTLRVPIHL